MNLDFLKEGSNSLVDDVQHGRPGAEETGRVCREQWWDYVIEVAEVAVLIVGRYWLVVNKTGADNGHPMLISTSKPKKKICNGLMEGPTDGQTDGPTNRRTERLT